jgi:hypothetical protein
MDFGLQGNSPADFPSSRERQRAPNGGAGRNCFLLIITWETPVDGSLPGPQKLGTEGTLILAGFLGKAEKATFWLPAAN